MTEKHYCWICGHRAIAFHPEPDGRKTYLCVEHLPAADEKSVERRGEEAGDD